MKYKLKFEIKYPSLEKDVIRDMKLNSILSNVNTEIYSDQPMNSPLRNDIIILGDIEYIVSNIKYKLDDEQYTIIVDVVDSKMKKLMDIKKIQRRKVEFIEDDFIDFNF